jgi:hypothetical protein
LLNILVIPAFPSMPLEVARPPPSPGCGLATPKGDFKLLKSGPITPLKSFRGGSGYLKNPVKSLLDYSCHPQKEID